MKGLRMIGLFLALLGLMACGALAEETEKPIPKFKEVSVHDPSIIRAEDGTFYIFGSHMAAAKSSDLIQWKMISTDAGRGCTLVENVQEQMKEALQYAQTTTFWAPDVQRLNDGRYYLYYCTCRGDSPLSLLGLAWINYHGAHSSLTINFFITAAAFATVILLLFSTKFFSPSGSLLKLSEYSNGLPYGPLGLIAAIGYSCWFFLGIEGTAMAADECRSAGRSVPLGGMLGIATLLTGGTITWLVSSGLMTPETLGDSVYPLYDAAKMTGSKFVSAALFVGSILACLASANGCINDSAEAWSALSRDGLIPNIFAKKHPKFGSHYISIIFLLPISLGFAMTGLLDQVVTFSIFSALIIYLLTCIMMFRFRKMYPLGTIKRTFTAPLFPILPIVTLIIVILGIFGLHLNYGINLIACTLFYFLASVWFLVRRYKYVDKETFMKAGLDKFSREMGE